MKIRHATKADLPCLVSLFDAYRVWYDKASNIEKATEFLNERLTQKDAEIFVCEDEGTLIGFTQLYPLFSSTRMQKLWLLNDLFVDENHRGKGTSLLLIDRAKQLVRDTHACALFLETHKTNKIGNSLYPRAGLKLNTGSNYYEWEVN